MTIDGERERYATKRDRLARLTRLVSILQAHPEGIRTAEVAERVGMSVRTVYRDLKAIDEEIGVPVWADGGRWGIDQEKAFLPPLKLTQGEAMAVVLSARLMARYADKYDPDLAAAFEKLEQGLPPALAEHVERTLDILSKAPRDEHFSGNVRLLTKAWAERRVVTIDYEQRTADVKSRNHGMGEAFVYLHKMPGPHNVDVRGNSGLIRVWRVVADATSYLVLFITISGIYLWFALRAERRLGLLLLLAGAGTFWGLVYAVAA